MYAIINDRVCYNGAVHYSRIDNYIKARACTRLFNSKVLHQRAIIANNGILAHFMAKYRDLTSSWHEGTNFISTVDYFVKFILRNNLR